MTYENKAFPLASGTSFNQYGPRGTEDGVVSGGQVHGSGIVQEKVVYITGDDFDSGLNFNTQLIVPAGSVIKSAVFEVTEVFTLGNVDNVFSIGTDTSEATNGFELANPDALGTTTDVTGGGTWAANATLAADTSVGVAVSGTTAGVNAGSGKAKVVISYVKV